jgi:glycosyltransferase involved in cell wall biosynthesis
MISTLILTKNESLDLPQCLESLQWCDDVHILDSFSTDETISIARKFNAKITQRVFDGYASQRNFGLTNLVYKYDWILILDADERIPSELVEEMKESVQSAPITLSAFRIQRKDFLWDKWLKHAQITPYYVRLIRKGKAFYQREINEVLEVDGEIKMLSGYFNHYPFSKGFSHWLNKHNIYSTMEAQRWIEEMSGNFDFSLRKALFSKDFSEKRYHQKGLFYKIPFRPIIKWLYMVVLKRSFLDGKEGLICATLQSIYEYFIVIKTREIIKKSRR